MLSFTGFRVFLEMATIAQELKKVTIFPQDQVRRNKMLAQNLIVRMIPELKDKNLAKLVNWLVYWKMAWRQNDPDPFLNSISDLLGQHAAFLASNFDALQNKLNNIDYTYEQFYRDDQAWHTAIAERARGEGATDGEKIITFPDGYFWVRLPRGFCSKEAEAMGHCGNSGGDTEDRIFSLRDSYNYPVLTFIVNHGALGESKAKANSKPNPKFHKYIAALLKSVDPSTRMPYIGYIKGGGHKPENNFALEDMTPEMQQDVLAVNPYLKKPVSYVLRAHSGKVPVINKFLGTDLKVLGIQNNEVFVENPMTGLFAMQRLDYDEPIAFSECYGWFIEKLVELSSTDPYDIVISGPEQGSEVAQAQEEFCRCLHSHNPTRLPTVEYCKVIFERIDGFLAQFRPGGDSEKFGWHKPDSDTMNNFMKGSRGEEGMTRDRVIGFVAELLREAWKNACGTNEELLNESWGKHINGKKTADGFTLHSNETATISLEDFEKLPQHKRLTNYLYHNEGGVRQAFVKKIGFPLVENDYLNNLKTLWKGKAWGDYS